MPLLRTQEEKRILTTEYSTFAIVEKTLRKVVEALLKNERLKKMLYYSDRNALGLPTLSPQQTKKLIENKQIRIVPKLKTEPDEMSYIIITLDNFTPLSKVEMGCTLCIDILCPYTSWELNDFKLRPYSIAGEIDAMLNKTKISDLNLGDFLGAKNLLISPDVGGLTLYYDIQTLNDNIESYNIEKAIEQGLNG